jgi:DNA polymerase-3 subunit gamma/tau
LSYQVTARKWRPQVFDEVVGQGHVTTPLRNAIRSGRVPHAVLLTGPRGVGKTTLARILARALNCEKGPTDTPCGACSACEEIAAGISTDVQEVDAASRTSVDDVRELIESIRYAPSPGKHRIFVVDEVHMLSTAAFNALLKTLEEPPPRSLFVLCTTNPEKIPFTVVSRCQRYDLRRIPTAEVVARLQSIAEAEGLSISEGALRAIAREGEGSMRDSQTLLDQVIAYGGTQISDETVAEVLDLIDRRALVAIAGACIRKEAADALEACGRALATGADPKRLGAALLQLLRDLVVLRVAPSAEGLVEGGEAELAELRALAEESDEARLRRMFRALVREQEDLAWAPQPEAVLEMAVVRLATLPEGDEVARLLTRLDALERRLAGDGGPGPGPGGGAPPPRRGAARRGGGGPRDGGRSAAPTPAASAPAPGTEAPPEPGPPPAEDAPPALVYDRLRGFAEQANRGLFASLAGGRLVEHEPGRIAIALPSAFHARRLSDRRTELEAVCARFFGRPVRVEVRSQTGGNGEAAPSADGRQLARQRRQAALGHPAVNVALQELQAEIVEIRPLGSAPSRGSD